MAPPVTSTPPIHPPIELSDLQELGRQDFLGFTQLYLLEKWDLIIDTTKKLSDPLNAAFQRLDAVLSSHVPQNPIERLEQERSKLLEFRTCDVMALDKLSALLEKRHWALREGEDDFDKYAHKILHCYLTKTPLDSLRKELMSKPALSKLLSFCDTAEKTDAPLEAFFATELGYYAETLYLIEVYKNNYKAIHDNPKIPVNLWLRTIMHGWVDEKLQAAHPELAEGIFCTIEKEHAKYPGDSCLDLLRLLAARAKKKCYPRLWKTYIKLLHDPSSDNAQKTSIETALCRKMEQDPRLFEAELQPAIDTLFSEKDFIPNPTLPQIPDPLKKMVVNSLETLHYSFLWIKYVKHLANNYPQRPSEPQFATIETTLSKQAYDPRVQKIIEKAIPHLNKPMGLKPNPKIGSVPPQVPPLLNPLMKKTWAQLFESPLSFLGQNKRRFVIVLPTDPELESARNKFASLPPGPLIKTYFDHLKASPAPKIQQVVETQINTRWGKEDFGKQPPIEPSLTIVELKKTHDTVALGQLQPEPRQWLIQALYDAIEKKIPQSTTADIQVFLDSMQSSPPNGWQPFVNIGRLHLFKTGCALYFDNLKNPNDLTPLLETSLRTKCTGLPIPSDVFDDLLKPRSLNELQNLHFRLSQKDFPFQKEILSALEKTLDAQLATCPYRQLLSFMTKLHTKYESVTTIEQDPQDSLGTLVAIAQKHLQNHIALQPTLDLWKSYLHMLADPSLENKITLPEIHRQLGQRKDTFGAFGSLVKEKKPLLTLKQLEQLEKTYHDDEPLLLSHILQELIAAQIWAHPPKATQSPSPFLQKLSHQRLRSHQINIDKETDPFVIALAMADEKNTRWSPLRERLHELPLEEIEKSCAALPHLARYTNPPPSIHDRKKAMEILSHHLSSSESIQLASLWKEYISFILQPGWPSQTKRAAQMRQAILDRPDPHLRAIDFVLRSEKFISNLTLSALQKHDPAKSLHDPFQARFLSLYRSLLSRKMDMISKYPSSTSDLYRIYIDALLQQNIARTQECQSLLRTHRPTTNAVVETIREHLICRSVKEEQLLLLQNCGDIVIEEAAKNLYTE